MSTRKKPPSPTHPIAKAIEDVLLAGHTPRIHVDARRVDVEVPDHVRERWQARLVIDLDPSWPLRLEYGPDGLGVDLAFQGVVTRCVFGWKAIYVVLDRATGRGTVIEAQLPPHELPPGEAIDDRGPRSQPALVPAPTPSLAPVSKLSAHTRPTIVPSEEPEAPAKRPRRSRDANAARVELPPPPDDTSKSTEASSEEKAKERRARFRVITGGG